MKKDVILSIRGEQTAPDEEPEIIELTTAAVLEREGDRVMISYQESPLTGLSGTVTRFTICPGQIILERHGTVESVMEFVEGKSSEFLYSIEDGALLLRVTAKRMRVDLNGDEGSFDLCYGIEIEGSPMGVIDYHIEIHSTGAQ